MITVSQAQDLINQNLPIPIAINLPIEVSLGYNLAENITAERDHPPFDRVTHDGIAINHNSLPQQPFKIESYAAAGQKRARLIKQNYCIEVATGAPLPEGADTIIPYELVDINNGFASVKKTEIKPGNCLHKQGSDAKKGEILLHKDDKIGITEITILAANGIAKVPVYKKPAIGILATGDELVGIAEKILPHQIRRSNDIMLKSALALNGFIDVEIKWLPDNKDKIAECLNAWFSSKDVIITIGGVSKGSYDYVPQVLENLGTEKIFHNVAQRPGKPLWFGRYQDKTLIFGLPGNPASSLTCLTRYVIPAFNAKNSEQSLALNEDVIVNESLTLFIPIKLQNGKPTLLKTQGSGDFISLRGSTGFAEIPPTYISGEKVIYYPWVKI